MRLLLTVVCCSIVFHGSSSLPGFRRNQAESFLLDQDLGQGISLKDEVVKDGNGPIADNQAKEQPLVTNIRVQGIIQNNYDTPVQKDTGIGNYNSNAIKKKLIVNENSKENTDYSVLSSDTSDNRVIEDSFNSDSGIKNVVQFRSKREVAMSKKTVKTYRYVSQPRRSRFSYIQKIQKLFNPKQVTTPKILTKHKTIVVEKHTAHEEHNSEEIHEHHTTTTSQLKISKKKRKSKRKPGSLDTTGSGEDYEDNESTEEETAKRDGLAIKDNSSNVIEVESKTKNSKLKTARVVQPNISVAAIRNKTQNSLEKKENETKENNIVLDNKTVSRQTMKVLGKEILTSQNENDSSDHQSVDISRTSNTDLIQKEEGTNINYPTQTTNDLKSNPQNENLPNFSTLPVPNYKQSSSQNVLQGGRNLKSFFKNVFGLRGINSPERTNVEVKNSTSILRESESVRNISTDLNKLNDKETSTDVIIDNREHTLKDSNHVNAPSESPRVKETKFKIPKNNPTSSMRVFYNTGLKSEEENTEINHNMENYGSETIYRVPKVQGGVLSVPNLPNMLAENFPSISKSIKTTKNVAPINPAMTREDGLGIDITTGPKEVENDTALPLTTRIISNQPDLGPSQPTLIVENLSSVPNEPNLSKNILTVIKPSTTIENSARVTSSQSSKKRDPKFRRPKYKTITTSKEVSFDTDVNGSEEENTEINNNDEIDTDRTVLNVPTDLHTYSKPTTTIQNGQSAPSSQSLKTRIPKFRRPKSKTITTSKEILYGTDAIDSEKENTEMNNNVVIDSRRTVFKIPKIVDNLPSLPKIPNVPHSNPTEVNPLTTINNLTNIISSQPSNTRVTKIRTPGRKTITTKNEVLHDTDSIESQEENTEINKNIQIDTDRTVFKVTKIGGNLPSRNVQKSPTTVQIAQSSEPSMMRIPKFKRPLSKKISTSKEIYETEIDDSEEEITEINRNNEINNNRNILNIPNTVGNLTPLRIVPDELPNITTNPKSSTVQNLDTAPSSHPSKKRVPKFRRPKSKTITTSKDVNDEDEDNTELNQNVEINNNRNNLNIPKTVGNLPLSPNVDNVSANVATVEKSQTAPSSHPSKKRVPKFRRPKSKTITTSKEVNDEDEDNTELNQNVEINNNRNNLNIPKTVGNLPLSPNVDNVSANVATVEKSQTAPSSHPSKKRVPKFRRPKSKTITTSKEVNDEDEDNTELNQNVEINNNRNILNIPKTVGNLPLSQNVDNVSANVAAVEKSQTAPSSHPSKKGVPKFRRPKSKTITTSKDVNDEDEDNTELNQNVEINNNRNNLNIPKTVGNLPLSPNVDNVSANVATVEKSQTAPSSHPSKKRVPKFRRPKSKTITTSKEVNDEDEDNTELNQNVEINNNRNNLNIPKTVGILPLSPNVDNVSANVATVEKSQTAPSSHPSKKRVPKFRRPKSKTITTSKEVNDEDEDNTELNQNVEINNNRNILNIPKTVGNLPLSPNVDNESANVATVEKSQTAPSSHPSKKRVPKFRRPKSKTKTKDVSYVTDVVDLEDENTEINNSNEVDNSRTVFITPKIDTRPPLPNVPNVPSNIPTRPKPTTIKNWPNPLTLQLSKTRIPKFSWPKNKTVTTLKEVLYDTEDIDSEKENTESNDNIDVDSSRTVFEVPKIKVNLPSLPNIPNVPQNIQPVIKPPKAINDSTSTTSSQPSNTRVPKIRTPKNNIITTSKEVEYDTDDIDSEKENAELNDNIDVDTSRIVFEVPKINVNLPSLPNVPNVPQNIQPVIKPSKAINDSTSTTSSQPSNTRVPKIRTPKSNIITTSKEVEYDTDDIDSEKETTELNDNIDVDTSRTVFEVPKIKVNLPSLPNVPNVPQNIQPIIKPSKAINDSTSTTSSQPSNTRVPKIRTPKSNIITTSKEVEYDTDDIDSEKETTELNDNIDVDTSRTVFEVPKIKVNLPSLPNVPNVPQNIQPVIKPSKAINDSTSTTSSQPSNTRVPKIRTPKSNIITTSKEVEYDTDDIDSEKETTELNDNIDVDTSRTVFEVPKIKVNLPSLPNVPNVPQNIQPVIKPSKAINDSTSTTSSQPSNTRVPKIRTPKSNIITTSKEVEYDTDDIDSEKETTELNDNIDVDTSRTVFEVPKIKVNLPSLPNVPNVPQNIQPVIKPSKAINDSTSTTSSQPSNTRVPKIRTPKNNIITTSKEVEYDTDVIESEEKNTEINHKTEIPIGGTIFKFPKVGGNLPTLPGVHRVLPHYQTVPKATTTMQSAQSLEPSITRIPQFKKPKNKTIITSKEIYDTEVHDSVEELTEMNYDTEIDNGRTILKIDNAGENPHSLLNQQNEYPNISATPKSITTVKNSQTPQSSQPKSKTITTSKEVSYDIDSKYENTEINHNVEIDNSGTVYKIPNIQGNIPSPPNIRNESPNIPTVPKLTPKIQNWANYLTSQPSNTRIPKFRRPKSKAVVTLKEINDKNVIGTEDVNTEVNHNVEIDNSGTVFKISKTVGKLPSPPNVPNLFADIPLVPKLTTIIKNTKIPKFWKPKSKTITTPKEILYGTDVIDSEKENTDINNYAENVLKSTEGLEKNSPVSIVSNLSSMLPSLTKEPEAVEKHPVLPIGTKVAGKPPASTENRPVNHLKSLVTKHPELERQKNKKIPVSVEESNDKYILNLKNDDTQFNNNNGIENSETFNNLVGHLSPLRNIPKLSKYIPDSLRSITNFGNRPATPTSQLSPTQRIPLSRTFSPLMDFVSDNDDNHSKRYSPQVNDDTNEYLTQPKAIGDIPKVPKPPKPAANLPAAPRLPTSSKNQFINVHSQTSESKIPEHRGPETIPTIDAAKDNSEEMAEINGSEVDKVTKTLFNFSNVVGNLPHATKLSAVANNLSGLKTAIGNGPFFAPSEGSPYTAPKNRRPKTKTASISTEASIDKDEIDSKLDNAREINNENNIDNKDEADFKLLTNLQNVPKVAGNLADILKSPRSETEPADGPSQTSPIGIAKTKRPNTKNVSISTEESKDTGEPNSEEVNTEIKNEKEIENNTESNFNDHKILDNVPNILIKPKVAENIPKLPKTSKYEPVDGLSGTSTKNFFKTQKIKVAPTTTDSKIHSEEINDNRDTFINQPKELDDHSSVLKVTAADNNSDVKGSPKTFGYWPFFDPSQTSPIRVPKFKRPNTKAVPTSSVESKDTNELNSEEDTEINNENIIDNNTERNFKVPMVLKNLPNISNEPKLAENIPRSPKKSENEPVHVLLEPSLTKNPKPQKPNTKKVPDSKRFSPEIKDNHDTVFNLPQEVIDQHSFSKKSAESDILPDTTSSPMKFGNSLFFAPSPASPIRVPKLKRPNTKPVISSVELEDSGELSSKEDNKEINNENEIINNSESYLQVPKLLKNHPRTTSKPKVPGNLPNIPGSLRTDENDVVNDPSQPSVIKIHKPQKPKLKKTKAVPTSTNSNIYSPGLEDNQGTSINQPEDIHDEPSVSKVPALADYIPVGKSSPMAFGNWPFVTPSQTSPTRVPKQWRPNSKAVPPSPETYIPEHNDNTEAFYNVPNFVSNFHPFNYLPRLTENIIANPGTLMPQKNKTFYSSSIQPLIRFPKLSSPKSKFTSLFPGRKNNDNFNANGYGHEVHDGTETIFNLPEIRGNFHPVPKEHAVTDNLQAVTKSPMAFQNWPFYAPSHTTPARNPKLLSPKNKAVPLSQDILYRNEDLHSESYSSDVNNEIKRFFNTPQSGKPLVVPRLPAMEGNRPVIGSSQPSVAKVPKLERPSTAKFHDTGEFHQETDHTDHNSDIETDNTGTFFNYLKSIRNLPFISKLTENFRTVPKPSKISKSQRELPSPLSTRDTTFKRPTYNDVSPLSNNFYDGADNLFKATKFVKNLPFVPKVPKLTGNIPYVSRRPTPFRNWPVRASPQLSVATLPYRSRLHFMPVKPSTRVYYANTPGSEMYNAGHFFRGQKSQVIKGTVQNVQKLPLGVNDQIVNVPKLNMMKNGASSMLTQFPHGKVVPNSEFYNRKIVSNEPSIIGLVRPIPKVPTSLHIPYRVNIPTTAGNIIPAPKISLIAESRRKVPMIIENHPHLVVASPAYTAMKLPIVKKTKNWIIPSASGISHRSDAINSKSYNTFLMNNYPKVSTVRKPQVPPIPSPSIINSSKAWNGLYNNGFFPSSKKNAGVLNIATFNTGLSDTIHLQMGEDETMDMVALERRAGRTIWGVPISNAAGKMEYLTVGDREGDMNFITSTDRLGRVVYLYRVRDDIGRYHNLHLKTTGGHLSLVESDYNGGQHSTGFIGYDETGEYIIPIHFGENHRLVIDPYAHSLRNAVDVHPVYEIVTEVF